MRMVDIGQGTDAWRAWRHGGIGSSDAPAIVGVSRWRSAQQVWSIKTGAWQADGIDLEAGRLARGGFLEPTIRARYEAFVGREAPARCVAHDSIAFVRASLDGLRTDGVPLEVKAASRRDHRAALEGRLPVPHAPQMVHALLATGASEAHYASYNADAFTGDDQLVVLVVSHDARAIEALLAIEATFWRSIEARKPPPRPGLPPPVPRVRRLRAG